MTSFQKTIKYLATALALFLAIGIIFSLFSFLISLDFISNDENNETTDNITTYSISNNIKELDIDLSAADFDIIAGNDFEIISSDEIKVEENFNKLTISEDSSFWNFDHDENQIKLYIPENTYFEKVSIASDAGDIDIENITADRIEFEFGAGDVIINNITVFDRADIDGGAGKITIDSGTVTDLDFNMGVGEISLTSELKGSCTFDQGVGNADITLLGNADDYSIQVNKGIGETIIDGMKAKDDTVYGFGINMINLNCGIGNFEVSFIEQ